ncbi:hypothetical protein ABIH81_06715 [Micromonospora sp. HUAS YX12]|uniref:Uncharacterized protein n=1 Tax=Micromonospora sp. HUAS YX12 TaxID=3156396 RepID=A0AAU7R419_9ACTN
MSTEMDLHEAMDAVAATTPPLDASAILAGGRRRRARRKVLVAGTTAAVILGFGAALVGLPLMSRPADQTALPIPTVTTTPSSPAAQAPNPTATPSSTASSATATPTLEPAERFVRLDEKPFDGAYVSEITDKSLPSGNSLGPFPRLIRDAGTTKLPSHVDDVAPREIRVSGVKVRLYVTEGDEDVQQAEWIHDGSLFVLQWMPQEAPHQISEADVKWMIASSIDGGF